VTQRKNPLDILFHDYGGYGFTAQLARHLARKGVSTAYFSFGGFGSPKGRVGRTATDPACFAIDEINISEPVNKDNLIKRYRQQIEYGRTAAARVIAERPKIVVSSNCPLEVQSHLLAACRKIDAKFVFWLQDLHSEAIGRILGRRVPLLGSAATRYYSWMEGRLLADSDAVIVITDGFTDLIKSWGVDTRHFTTIENWAPIGDMPLYQRDNDVANRHFRPGRPRILYSGTLARKHNPDILLNLARNVDADIHLYSMGSAAEYVRGVAAEEGLGNMFVRPWVSVEDLPKVLAGADILCGFIEKDAGRFSVPSKILSYLAAGRPILASMPAENLASRTIVRAGAGLVSDPGNPTELVDNAARLLSDPEEGRIMGQRGRDYAERTFDIDVIARRFQACFASMEEARPRKHTMLPRWRPIEQQWPFGGKE